MNSKTWDISTVKDADVNLVSSLLKKMAALKTFKSEKFQWKADDNSEKWDISGKKMTDNDMLLIEPLLRTMPNLKSLTLRENNIGDKGAKAIVRALEGNETLKELNLSANAFGDEGAKAIATALEGNETLKELNLSANAFGDEGAKAIGAALEGNETLKKLDL